MIASVWRQAIRSAVDEAKPYSFGDPQRITEWAEVFVEAHLAAPGGLSIEIGSWRGGTALVFLRLLERLYPADRRPMLFTIDPYGDKPYNGGDGPARPPLYGNADYVVMKQLLARFPNHAHFYMTSATFFCAADNYKKSPVRYWWNGGAHEIERVTFALVDAEHDAESIRDDVHDVGLLMAPDGIVVVDNVDNDPRTDRLLGLVARTQGRVCESHVAALRRLDGAPQRYAVLRPFSVEAACR